MSKSIGGSFGGTGFCHKCLDTYPLSSSSLKQFYWLISHVYWFISQVAVVRMKCDNKAHKLPTQCYSFTLSRLVNSPQDVHFLIPGAHECHLTWEKGLCRCDKVEDLVMERPSWTTILGSSQYS